MIRRRSGLSVPAALALFACAACASDRDRPGPAPHCPTWQDDLAAAVKSACASCHEADEPAAGYDLSSYLGAIAEDDEGRPRAVAGDPSSPLLLAADPSRAEPPHDEAADPALFADLEAWVVDCDLAYTDSRIHEPGIMNPRDGAFHGQLLRDTGWDFAACADCHGDDFEGGVTEASCTTCHTEGPTDCSTCHAGIYDSPPHAAHLQDGPLARAYECAACHPTPSDYRDPGHIFGPDGEVLDEPARVELGALANHTPPGAEREGPATFDRETMTCSNVFCHGDVHDDPAASHTRPAWTDDPDQAACGTCHGDPPADHARAECGQCHQTMPRDGALDLDLDLHISGAVDIRGDGDCAGCHGTGDLGAPPPDLQGRTSPRFVTVGAHRAHLEAPRGLSAPIACEACHIVPDEVSSPGHIDTPGPAEVFPAGHDSLAYAAGADPEWNRQTATCSDAYCHGGGDIAAGTNPEPLWTAVGQDEAACGGCHGIPPEDGEHAPDLGLADCHGCHADTVDPFGNIIVSGPPDARESAHINGEIDVTLAGAAYDGEGRDVR